MRGISKNAAAAAGESLEALLASGADCSRVAEDLFGATGLLAGNASLRKALTDSSHRAEARVGLVDRLLSGQVGAEALELLRGLVLDRWASPGDLTDTVEALAVTAVLAGAERAGRLERVEDELFRFSRTVGGDVRLRDAFSARTPGGERKEDLVRRLLEERAAPETVRLAVQAAKHPRGLRTEWALTGYVAAAAERRQQLIAHVVVTSPLDEPRRERLQSVLRRIYRRPIQVNIDIDPQVLGGLRVEIVGQVLDGTVLGRMDRARRALAG
jgi:F-type H+-transporting ATPase subunit delta